MNNLFEKGLGFVFGTAEWLAKMAFVMVLVFGLAIWFCHINPNVTYEWYEGFWHGLFIVPNGVMHLVKGSVHYRAVSYTSGYNMCWWLMIIWQVICVCSMGKSKFNYKS